MAAAFTTFQKSIPKPIFKNKHRVIKIFIAGPGVVTALNAVKNHNLSVALHNPGWTWVDFKSGRRRSSKLEYFRIAKKFWADVMPFLK